ncbi:MAG: hypothetical protein MR039_06710, partial [Elusimicrobia bacterium]|nr:hypothetical protein [Elusimicrobiota bacterium]
KINFIMSEEFANKKVTASLTRVSVREALDTLLRVHGLAYQRIGKSDSYVVTKRSNDAPDTITKIYTLSYISLQGIGSAQSELNSIMPQDVSSSSSSSSSGTDMSVGGASGGSSYSGGAEITAIIKSMLSPVGKIAVDPRTNKLIITDVAEVFPQVENILAELDIKPPQILIEAQIVEVSKTSGLSLGFEYGGDGGIMATMTGPKRKVDLEYMKGQGVKGWNYIFPSKDQLNDGSSSGSGSGSGSSSSSSDSGEDEGGLLDFSAFNIVLKSLLTRGEAKYLGKPKVVTLNNKTATITTSTDATVGRTMSQSGSGSGEGMTTTSAERKRVGLTLQVTPQVNREGYVTLYVQPSYSDLVSSGFDFSKDTTTRAASTLVRVKNGQTVVIGGLLTSRETDQTRKVPLLGDIPLLGWLFTSKTKSKSTTDLVIFITPTILAE